MSQEDATERPEESCLELALAALARRQRGEGPAGLLLGGSAAGLLAPLDRHAARRGGVVASGSWRHGLVRPYGGLAELADQLAFWALEEHPGLLRTYRLLLANLLPAWRKAAPVQGARILSSGLARFSLHGDRAGLKDFYWRRDETPLITADLVRFTITAADALARSRAVPTVLVLERLDLAPAAALQVVRLLAAYAGRARMLFCVVAPGSSTALLESLRRDGTGLWAAVDGGPEPERPKAEQEARKLAGWTSAQAASVWMRPFPADHGLQTGEALEGLIAAGILRRVGSERLSFASEELRGAAYESLPDMERRRLHAAALREEDDPFAAAWHARCGGVEAARDLVLPALEQAWGLSAHESALALAEQVGAGAAQHAGPSLDRDLLLALLGYDAGRFRDADQHLLAVLERRPPGGAEYDRLRQMLGYNAVFGLQELERGREILESVLRSFERLGLEQESGFLRNSIAFALFRLGRVDDAVRTEQAALEILADSAQKGGFLSSILLLNLGRLYRTIGFPDKALQHFRTAVERPGGQHSPSTLLLLYASIAYLLTACNRPEEALPVLEAFLELARDVDLDNIGDPILGLLSRSLDLLAPELLTRGDRVFFLLYANLALTCRRMGLISRSEAYLTGMRQLWEWLGNPVWEALAKKVVEVSPPLPSPSILRTAPRAGAEEAGGCLPGLLQTAARGSVLPGEVAAALAAGQSFAIVRPRRNEAPPEPLRSIVLLDPRHGQLARQLARELGVSSGYFPVASGHAPQALRAALVLPEELGRFRGRLSESPLVQQEAVPEPTAREELPALDPYRVQIQVLDPEHDGFLFEVLRHFARRQGLGVLAAVPFHLRRRDLARDPEGALHQFLVSSVDQLVVGDLQLGKGLGASAERNLLPFRPILSRHCVIESPPEGTLGPLRVRVRIAGCSNQLKMSGSLLPALRLCDGSRTVAEIARCLQATSPGRSQLETSLCSLFRNLEHHGVIDFESPAGGRGRPGSVRDGSPSP